MGNSAFTPAGGAVSVTGTAAASNLAVFSTPTSITGGNLSGDVTTSGTPVTTVVAVHGVTYPVSPSTNTVPVVTSTNTITYEQVPNAALANSSVTVSGVSGVTGGGAVALGSSITLGMADATANSLAGYNNSGVFSDVSIGTNLNLVAGILSGSSISGGSNITISYSGNNVVGITGSGGGAVSSVFGRTGVVTANWNDYQFNLIGGTATASQGGTGLQTLTAHAVMLGEGVNNVSFATTGIAARLLIDQGGVDPAFEVVSGDVSLLSTGVTTVLAVHGVTYPANPSTNTIPVVTSSNAITYTSIGSNLTISSNTLSANPGGSNTQLQYNKNTLFGGVINATSDGSNLFVVTQSTSDNSTKAASTAYVTTAITNAIAGVNPAVAVVVATTAAGDTSALTYNNGVSGVGATLTGSNNTALTFDGVTLTSLTQRVLVKNDTQSPSGAFNGIYTLTQLQGVALPPILTRALDFDQSSDINSTGAIPVTSGTLNGSTSWVITSTVNTVGTDPITFTKFSLNPTTIITTSTAAGGSLTGTYPNPTIASSAITAAMIGNSVVTYSKIQNESAYTLLGNNTGSSVSPLEVTSIIIGTPGYSTSGYNYAQISFATNNFSQLSIQNTSAGTSASADFVATNNQGTDSAFYIDTGINGSVSGTAPFTNANAGYLYVTSPELDIAAVSTNGVINFYTTGGMTPLKAGAFNSSQGLDVVGAITSGSVAVPTISSINTLTNKRITYRVSAITNNSAQPSINTDNFDVIHITSQTAAISTFSSNLTGTPVDGDRLRISVTGTSTVTMSWGNSFESSTVALPTQTLSATRLDMGFFYNTETNKWRLMASA